MILAGKVKVFQDTGASVTTDTLLLASALRATPGSVIVDLGCGSGAAAMYSATLNPGCRWLGLDIRYDPLKHMMSSRNMQGSSMEIATVCCSIETVTLAFSECIADAVIINSGKPHKIKNTGDEKLIFLCCCSPPYEHNDTLLL